jgi:hypothetical protein
LSKAKGEFHIAFGRKAVADDGNHAGHGHGPQAGHAHQFQISEIYTFNCTHLINDLSFGDKVSWLTPAMNGVYEFVPHGITYDFWCLL